MMSVMTIVGLSRFENENINMGEGQPAYMMSSLPPFLPSSVPRAIPTTADASGHSTGTCGTV